MPGSAAPGIVKAPAGTAQLTRNPCPCVPCTADGQVLLQRPGLCLPLLCTGAGRASGLSITWGPGLLLHCGPHTTCSQKARAFVPRSHSYHGR